MKPTDKKPAATKPAATTAPAPAATPAPAAPKAKADPEMYTGKIEDPKRTPKSVIRAAITKKTGVSPDLMRAAEQIAFRGDGHVPGKLASMSDADYKTLCDAAEEWVKVINKHEDIGSKIRSEKGKEAADAAMERAAMAKQRATEKEAQAKVKEANEKTDKANGELALKAMAKTDIAVNSSLESGLNFLGAFGSKGVKITAQGAEIDENLSAADTLAAMGKLVRGADGASKMVGNAFNFSLGDMVLFYAEHHGDTYTAFLTNMLEGTSLSLSHIRKLPTIAKAFPLSSGVRYPNLSWGHFQEAISSSPEKKEKLTEKDGKTPITDKTFAKLCEAFTQIRLNVLKEASEGDTTKTSGGSVTKVKPTIWVRTETAKRKLALYKAFSEAAREAIDKAESGESEGEGSGTANSKAKKSVFIVVPFEGAPAYFSSEYPSMLDGNMLVIDVANGRYMTNEDLVWTPVVDSTKAEMGEKPGPIPTAADGATPGESEEEVDGEEGESSDEDEDLLEGEDSDEDEAVEDEIDELNAEEDSDDDDEDLLG